MATLKQIAAESVSVRILREVTVGDVTYKPDQVVNFSSDQSDALAADGSVDANPDAVAYAVANGAVTVDHG